MVLLLNLLPLGLLAVGLGAAWFWRKGWLALVTVVVCLVYAVAQPSYLPKGEVVRAPLPQPEASDAPLQDRQPRPDPLAERDTRMREAVQNGLDFKK